MMLEDRVIRVLPPGSASLVRTVEHDIDDRWLRAFAVAVGDTQPEHFDLDHEGGVIGHPVFPVCLEWPLIEQGAPGIELTSNTLILGLHVSHRMRLHAPLRPSQRVRTEAELHLAESRTNAVHVATEFRTVSSCGELIATTHLGTHYRGVRLEGTKTSGRRRNLRANVDVELARIATFRVDATNAVIYSECTRIWNPIHTDIRVARAAGLPDTVLHGTEILARAVSAVRCADIFPVHATVTGIDCRFTSPVFPGMILTVNAARISEDSIAFDVQAPDATRSISGGRITFEDAGTTPRTSSTAAPREERA